MNKSKLSELCFVKGGKRLPKSIQTTKNVTLYKYLRLVDCTARFPDTDSIEYITEDVFKKIKNYTISKNDVYISVVGSIGIIGMIQDELDGISLTENANKLVIKDTNILDKDYLYYFLKSDFGQNQIKKGVVGSIQPKLPIYNIEKIEILLPDITIQQKIASVLSVFDSKIEINNRINTELEAMAKTLYDYWFVQFDFPNAKGKPYKTSDGKMVWNEELKREIPDGWDNGTLVDISELIRGVSYGANDIKEANDEGVIPILRATNISGNVIDLENMVFVNKKNVSSNQLLKKYDILMTMSSGSIEHIGKNGFFYFNNEVAYGAFCAKLVAKDGFHFYLYSYTQSDFMFTTIKNECLGTNINNLNSQLVNGFKIILPANNLIVEFNKKVSPAYEKIGNNLIENQKLSELRDWLLPMLMNGQVKVK